MKKQAEELVSDLFCELKKIDDEIKKSGIRPKWFIPVNAIDTRIGLGVRRKGNSIVVNKGSAKLRFTKPDGRERTVFYSSDEEIRFNISSPGVNMVCFRVYFVEGRVRMVCNKDASNNGSFLDIPLRAVR